MEIFGKKFDVALLSFNDKSTQGNPYREVIFTTEGEVYHYVYSGGPTMALSQVHKENRKTGNLDEVYSPWKNIPNGSYYEEIGRRLSVESRTNPTK